MPIISKCTKVQTFCRGRRKAEAYRTSLLGSFIGLTALKGQRREIFAFRFFYELVSPRPLGIPLGTLRIFLKLHGDKVFAAQGAPVSLTSVISVKNLQSEKFSFF